MANCTVCSGTLVSCGALCYTCPHCGRQYSSWEVEEMDIVNHPKHYISGQYESIDILKDVLSKEEFEGFCRGNVLKYLWRTGKKDKGKKLEDIMKAKWYLERLISSVEDNLTGGTANG